MEVGDAPLDEDGGGVELGGCCLGGDGDRAMGMDIREGVPCIDERGSTEDGINVGWASGRTYELTLLFASPKPGSRDSI